MELSPNKEAGPVSPIQPGKQAPGDSEVLFTPVKDTFRSSRNQGAGPEGGISGYFDTPQPVKDLQITQQPQRIFSDPKAGGGRD